MPEIIFYSEQVDERVAQYIAEHGGKVQTERVDPGWVFHKVTIEYTKYTPCEGVNHPVYLYTLADGGTILAQDLRGKGTVPGHPHHYWTALYIRRDDHGKAAREQTR